MRNHDQKTKDMVESVLPSTHRKGARAERRRIHKRARARQRNLLAAYAGGDFDPDFREGRRSAAIHEMVWDRRSYDNTGAVSRWAVEKVRRDPRLAGAELEEQVAHFAAMLPDDLIGRHAVLHIEWSLEFRLHPGRWRRGRPSAPRDRAAVLAGLRDQVTAILDAGGHRRLNSELRRAAYTWIEGAGVFAEDARLLAGRHDVEAFIEAIADSESARRIVSGVCANVGADKRSR